MCGHAGKNVQLQARPRGLIGVRREFNLLLHPIVIRRLTLKIIKHSYFKFIFPIKAYAPIKKTKLVIFHIFLSSFNINF